MDLKELDLKLIELNNKILSDEGKIEILTQQLEKTEKTLNDKEKYSDILTKVSVLFQKTSEFAREQSKRQIEDTVTKCLQFIFETDIEFLIELSESRSVPVAEFFVQSNYPEGYSIKTKPEISRGGGVVDIISLALRIAFLQLNQPKLSGPLILDEPGKHVSNDYIFNLGEFLKKSSNLFDRQIIMVTHNPHLSQICDKAFHVTNKNGISKVSIYNQ
ncbi:MAG: ATPase [Peptoniphilus sp.]|uniref:ATPase n=1 Tax=Peptoniphilus sp. TaxID=1971214 RepID=UPI0025D12BE1|nr:ATPase [Peptoniphilus sp.]MCI5642823.1 ATPase [Peptoniphilus sp.]MDD7352784.1 ATPase [Peptoniphilaceae bacterium]MDY3903303.1 ATPase [Peptoniphilus sp.]